MQLDVTQRNGEVLVIHHDPDAPWPVRKPEQPMLRRPTQLVIVCSNPDHRVPVKRSCKMRHKLIGKDRNGGRKPRTFERRAA